ncbi:MAG: TetR/AcrR family transcriptional regulator [Actinomycetia bacterium]|nr:TetR/AcrR family transcriptional regulator [Actinomycetes bacterium]
MIDQVTARTSVVEAADRLFYLRGVQAVGMDAVRTEADVSLKRIYSLFSSKDELIEAVLRHRTERWDAGIAAAAASAGSPREKILAVFCFLDTWFNEPDFRGCAFINAFGELGTNSPRVAEAVRKQKSAFREYITGLTREMGLPDDTAVQVVILAEGAQASAAILDDPGIAASARRAAEVLLTPAMR